MKRRMIGAWGLMACLVGFAGCVLPTPEQRDLESDAAAIAGRWCLEGDEQGFFGYFELDASGDPTHLEDNPVVRQDLGEDQLILDGLVHETESGLDYSAIARAVVDGTDVELYVEIHLYTYAFEVGALAMKFEGERVTDDRFEGISVTVQDFADAETSDLLIQTASASKNACD